MVRPEGNGRNRPDGFGKRWQFTVVTVAEGLFGAGFMWCIRRPNSKELRLWNRVLLSAAVNDNSVIPPTHPHSPPPPPPHTPPPPATYTFAAEYSQRKWPRSITCPGCVGAAFSNSAQARLYPALVPCMTPPPPPSSCCDVAREPTSAFQKTRSAPADPPENSAQGAIFLGVRVKILAE